jgi:hypothetical protein
MNRSLNAIISLAWIEIKYLSKGAAILNMNKTITIENGKEGKNFKKIEYPT